MKNSSNTFKSSCDSGVSGSRIVFENSIRDSLHTIKLPKFSSSVNMRQHSPASPFSKELPILNIPPNNSHLKNPFVNPQQLFQNSEPTTNQSNKNFELRTCPPKIPNFLSPNSLQTPKRILDEQRPHQCNFIDPVNGKLCQENFKRSDDLSRHSMTHTTEKLKVCPFPGCNYKCNRKDNMECHTRTHSGAKPYVCPYLVCNQATGEEKACGYAAVRQDDWTKHCMKIHLEKVSESTLNPDKETWHRTKNTLVIKKYRRGWRDFEFLSENREI